jgi:tungstate transport system substrate-binding protein
LFVVGVLGCVPAQPTAFTPAPSPAAQPSPTPVQRSGSQQEVILATTTSTQDSGLLDVLLPIFEARTGYHVKPISVGTGAALALGARGEADVVLVHAPESERRWMADGYGTQRLLVMHNDFVILGPPSDPAGIKGQASVSVALQRVAQRGAAWVSRDDNSGTHQLEQQLWRAAGLAPAGQPWFIAAGQGMGATLVIADQKDAYTLSDRGTFLARRGSLRLEIMVSGDQHLLNVYHVMPVNAARFPALPINAPGGQAFARFLVSPEAQAIIADFGKDRFGEPLFFPDAGKSEEELGP